MLYRRVSSSSEEAAAETNIHSEAQTQLTFLIQLRARRKSDEETGDEVKVQHLKDVGSVGL